MNQPLSASLYHRLVRPRWLTRKYIHDPIRARFPFDGRYVLDFGSDTGANCPLADPTRYIGVDPEIGRASCRERV